MPIIEMLTLSPVSLAAKQNRGLFSPAWRYQRAVAVVDSKSVLGDEDPVVDSLAKYILATRGADPIDRPKIDEAFPIEAWASEIFNQNYAGPRFHIEALVLGKLDSDEIADQFAIPPEVVRFYELAFFDMRPHVGKANAIKALLTSKLISMRSTRYDPDIAWKLMALDDGPEAVMSMWSNGQMEDRDMQHLDRVIAANTRRIAVQAQQSRQITNESIPEIMNEYWTMRNHEAALKKMHDDAVTTNTAQQTATSLLASVVFSVAAHEPMSDDVCAEFATIGEDSAILLSRLRGRKEKDNSNGKV